MFWYNKSTVEELIRIAASFKESSKIALKEKLNHDLPNYSFYLNVKDKRKDIPLITDNELLFINHILEVEPYSIALVEEALQKSFLSYDSGRILNKQGACAVVSEEYRGGEKQIRKTTISRSILEEYEILDQLNKYLGESKDYVIRLIPESFNKDSFVLEAAIDSLEHYIENNRNLQIGTKLSYIKRIIACVLFVHNNGVVHRDLHPGNFLAVGSQSSFVWKLSDFGFACFIKDLPIIKDEQKTSYGRADYTAPEQLTNLNRASEKSDIYSIGKLINFIMTGSPKKNNHMLHDISEKCCRKNEEERYFSVNELQLSLNALLQSRGLS